MTRVLGIGWRFGSVWGHNTNAIEGPRCCFCTRFRSTVLGGEFGQRYWVVNSGQHLSTKGVTQRGRLGFCLYIIVQFVFSVEGVNQGG